MSINADDVLKQMLSVAAQAFGAQWDHVKSYVPGEFKKFAVQVAEVGENVAKYEADATQGYPPETGKVLLQMQRTALESVLTAMTALTLLAIQNAINGILDALRKTLGGIVAGLLP